ncbi:hypothetical protein [Gymnodinialimonas ceratoperidinii]|uniref:Lipoprotein n=1 Tax=Gymnodinialimonas ceratoperidinii TaxID=2856823 RepID=A0A8F6TZ96_9RHOB|nr:hypothetical protein [Gymnodinialimonas ceratoperidinii]QXT40456.1 hypothetical protein KYE46_04190 [Gymnodinialimonas ceratoperidinii]
MIRNAIFALPMLALVGCVTTQETDVIIVHPESVQIAAHEACFAEQRIAARFTPHVRRVDDSHVIVTTVHGNGVTVVQAEAVNQCARARLVSGSVAPAGAGVYVVPAPTYHAPVAPTAGCREGFSAMQAGTRICVGYSG